MLETLRTRRTSAATLHLRAAQAPGTSPCARWAGKARRAIEPKGVNSRLVLNYVVENNHRHYNKQYAQKAQDIR